MQALVDRIFENKSLTFLIWVIAFLLVAALILFIFRLAFGRRLKTPGGGRTRLPRLGVVVAFDLDRHRQLVIVRRDNVEHLLMIGGPNDLVIESEIVRAEGREMRLRDRDAREKEPREALQASVQAPSAAPSPTAPPWQPEFDPAPGRASHPQPPRKTPVPPPAPASAPLTPEPEAELPPAAVVEEPVASSPAVAPPAPRAPAFPLPPRRVAQPLTAQRTPREPLPRPDLPSRIEAGAGPSGGFQRAPLATPFLRTSPPRQLTEPKPPAASSYPGSRPPGASAAAADAPATAPADGVAAPEASAPFPGPERIGLAADVAAAMPTPASAPPAADKFSDPSNLSIDSLDQSLEDEMARLLGRGS